LGSIWISAVCVVAALATSIAASVLLIAIRPPRSAVERLVALWAISFAQIVFLSEALSELHSIGRPGFLIGHVALLGLAALAWRAFGGGSPMAALANLIPSLRRAIGSDLVLLVFLAGTALVLLANFVLAPLVPFYNPDAYAYHIPRAYSWWQSGTARPFPSNDFRHNEFPPNASFVLMWTMVLSGGYALLHALQWTASLVGALSLAGLARLAGHTRAAALFAGLFFPLFPLIVYQMGTSQNDVVIAALALAGLLFGLRTIDRFAAGESWRTEALLCGCIVGLAVGTKLTFTYVAIPGLVGAVVFAIWRARRRWWRPLVPLAVASVAGILLLGAYQYVLNVIHVGHPLANDYLAGWLQTMRTPENSSLLGNMFRSTYTTLDWVGIVSGEHPILLRQIEMLRSLMGGLGLDIDNPSSFIDYRYLTTRPPSEVSGYGLFIFPLMLASLVVFPLAIVIAGVRHRAPSIRLTSSALLAAMGWGTILCAAVMMIWDKTTIRYYIAGVTLVAAATLPWLYPRSLAGRVAAASAAALSLYVAFHVTWNIGERSAPGALAGRPPEELVLAGRAAKAVGLMRDSLPPGSRIAVLGGSDTPWFVFIQPLPMLRFEMMAPDDALSGFDAGGLAAILVDETAFAGRFPLPAGFEHLFLRMRQTSHLRLTLPNYENIRLFAHEPVEVLKGNLARYGLSAETASLERLAIADVAPLTNVLPDFWYDRASLMIPQDGGKDRLVLLRLAFAPRAANPGSVMCNKLASELRLDGDMLRLRIPAAAALPNELFIHCDWTWDAAAMMPMRLASTKEIEAEARSRNALLLARTGMIGSVPADQPNAEAAILDAFARTVENSAATR
jgi:hypothetical protein